MFIVPVLGLVYCIYAIKKGQRSEHRTCVDYDSVKLQQLKKNAQDALNAISSRNLSSSEERAKRGQHVFNNGILGFHRSVLQDLLTEMEVYEQLDILMQDVVIPLDQTVQNTISNTSVYFRAEEIYVDCNADVFGEYVKQLRATLVAYLIADTAVYSNETYRTRGIDQQVRHITTLMVDHEVYVDPMACDRWLSENPRGVEQYNQATRAIAIMFRNILQDFQNVSVKIKESRLRNNWNNRSDL